MTGSVKEPDAAACVRLLDDVTSGLEGLVATSLPSEMKKRLVESLLGVKEALEPLLYVAPHPSRGLDWVRDTYVSQSIQFMTDCLPTIQQYLLENTDRGDVLTCLDVGAGSGAGANLLAMLHRGHSLWCKVDVDAVDVNPSREHYARLQFPDVNYMVDDIFRFPEDRMWDFAYCSHCIEHVKDVKRFIDRVVRLSRRWAFFYAPYDEQELSRGHVNTINEDTFADFDVLELKTQLSMAWHPGKRTDLCILAVVRGTG